MSALHPLNVIADLSLAVDGADVRIHADGRTVVVAAPSLRVARDLLQDLPSSYRTSTRLGQLHGLLEEADLTVEVRVRGDRFARIGADAEGGAMSRFLRLGEVEVRPTQPVASSFQRHPGTTLALAAAGVIGGAALLYFLFGRD